MREALDWAGSIDHPLSLAFACHFAATFHQCRRETDVVRELEEAGTKHSTKHGFELFLNLGAIYRGWLLSEKGEHDEAVTQIRLGLSTYSGSGAELGTPTFLGMLAEVHDRLERPEDGRSLIADAVAMVERTGQHYWDAELRRLNAALALRADPGKARVEKEAESLFLEAIEIARRQEAKLLELRAATSLSLLWKQQGKASKARVLLSDAYRWFSEGFETADVMDAKVLLEELQAPGSAP
jgi:predicted ATPase